MTRAMTRVMFGGALLSLASAVAVAQPTSTSQTSTKGAATSRTQTLSGTVIQVDGNTVAVKMSSGEVRMFNPPPDRRFVVDGKELRADQLAVGTRLKATVTETSTPVTDRTVQSLEGRVWYAAAPTVILTLPNGQNRQYTVASDSPVKFTDGEGKPITVFDLRKDMNVKAVKITEAQRYRTGEQRGRDRHGPGSGCKRGTGGTGRFGGRGSGGIRERGRSAGKDAAQDGDPAAPAGPHRHRVTVDRSVPHGPPPPRGPLVPTRTSPLRPSVDGRSGPDRVHAPRPALHRLPLRRVLNTSSCSNPSVRFVPLTIANGPEHEETSCVTSPAFIRCA